MKNKQLLNKFLGRFFLFC